jgi:antitoxin ParD1/3/4
MAKTTSFVLGEHFEQLIAQQMHTGRYSSASEVVREALRIFENQQAAIKRLNDAIEEGYASGFVDELDWDALDKRADKAAADA